MTELGDIATPLPCGAGASGSEFMSPGRTSRQIFSVMIREVAA